MIIFIVKAADNFNYEYYSGTNRLSRVRNVPGVEYEYDYNGNMIKDELNRNSQLKYDQRNLMTELRNIKYEQTGPGTGEDFIYQVLYYYDESGNRIHKKVYKYIGPQTPDPVFEEDNPGSWQLIKDEYYVRDASGKEIAIYEGATFQQWNVYGFDNIGKIDNQNHRYFYLKDHLGSIRAVLDTINTVVSAQDFDCWGYLLENRTYESGQSLNQRYKFTGKERDNESAYDYFGARYYDGRIGRWGGVDILGDKNISYSPYNYSLDNPIVFIDPNGLILDFSEFLTRGGKYVKRFLKSLGKITGLKLSVDERGYLTYETNRGQPVITGGSETARNILLEAIQAPGIVKVLFSEPGTSSDVGGDVIRFDPEQIKGFMEGVRGGLSKQTMGYGTSFVHEILHTKLGIGVDDPTGFGQIGKVEEIINVIRQQLGGSKTGGIYGQRLSYGPLLIYMEGNLVGRYIPFDKESYSVMEKMIRKNKSYSLMGKYVEY